MNDMVMHRDTLVGAEMYQERLSCGMDAYFIPLHRDVNLSLVHLFTNFGSIDAMLRDPATGETMEIPDGSAHFLEHCAFYDKNGKDAMQEMSKMGINGNAWTFFDHTTYHFKSDSSNHRKNLDFLIDFVTTPHLTKDVVKKEQGVITQEITMYNDQPRWVIDDTLRIALLKEHPFRRSIAGQVETIMQITDEYLQSAYETFYSPSNLSLVIFFPGRGNIKDLAREHFRIADDICQSKGFEYKAPPEYIYVEEPEEVAQKRVDIKHNVPEPSIAIGFKGCMNLKGSKKERMKYDLANVLLSETLFNRGSDDVYQIIKDKVGRNNFYGGHFSGRGFGYFTVKGSTPNPEAFEERVIGLIKEGLDGKMSEEIFELQKKMMIKEEAEKLELEDPGDLEGDVIVTLAADLNPIDKIEALTSITYEDVVEAGKKYLDTEEYSVVVAHPREQ